MLILKCTQKAAKELGVKRSDLPQIPASESESLLGPWFVNALKFGRNKALLFTNERTLYSFLVPYLQKDLAHLKHIFLETMLRHFLAEQLPPLAIDSVMNDYQGDLILAKTDSRSVLGYMNETAFTYEILIQQVGGLPYINLMAATQNINRTPNLKLGGAEAIDLLREALAANGASSTASYPS